MLWRWLWTGLAAAGLTFSETPDPLTAATAADVAAGKRVFDSQCALCHGIGGTGGRGPALAAVKLRHASDGQELIDLVVGGIEANGMPAFWFLGERPAFQVAAYVRSIGSQVEKTAIAANAEHGAVLYQDNGCAGCHVVNGAGSAYGPELSDVGARRSSNFIKESLLDPNASLPLGFAMVRAASHGGAAVTGVRVNEDSFTIQLRDASGHFHSFRKQDLANLQKIFDKSPMPSYRGKLSDSDIDDLIAWLASLRRKT